MLNVSTKGRDAFPVQIHVRDYVFQPFPLIGYLLIRVQADQKILIFITSIFQIQPWFLQPSTSSNSIRRSVRSKQGKMCLSRNKKFEILNGQSLGKTSCRVNFTRDSYRKFNKIGYKHSLQICLA